jgi:N-acetylglutamate synthase-like GNAT family acetyltransferase
VGRLLLGVALVFFAVLFWIERRAADPILPLPLLHERLFSVAVTQGALSGWALFGSTNFVPLFGQGVLGLSATAAGSALTPMMLCWTAASIAGGRLLLRFGYRPLALLGTAGLAAGAFMLTRLTADSTLLFIMVCLGVMGAGMGLAAPAFLIAVQSSVQRARLGTATATLQFSRSMGGTLGVSVMGVILTAQLAASLAGAGVSAAAISLGELIDSGRHAASAIVDSAVRLALSDALNSVFVAAFIAAAIALGVTFLTPRGRIRARPAPEPDAASSPAPPAALQLTIRPAAAGDQSAITAMVRAAKLNPFRLRWRDFLVAEMDGRIVGVGQVRPHGDGSRELASLVVTSDHRGAGIGSQLVGALLAREAGPVYLFCREQLAAFYTPFGFERQDPRELPAALATMHRLAHWMTRAEALFVGRRVQIVAMRRHGSATTPPAI